MAVKNTTTLGAGDLNRRVRFEKRVAFDDAAGNTLGDWVAQFERNAYIGLLQGGEAIIERRLTQQSPAVIIVRFDWKTSQITNEWKVVEILDDADESEITYAIAQVQDMDRNKKWVTLLVSSGAPA